MQLVIAEKPSVARSIAEVIGATEISDGYMEGNGYYSSLHKAAQWWILRRDLMCV